MSGSYSHGSFSFKESWLNGKATVKAMVSSGNAIFRPMVPASAIRGPHELFPPLRPVFCCRNKFTDTPLCINYLLHLRECSSATMAAAAGPLAGGRFRCPIQRVESVAVAEVTFGAPGQGSKRRSMQSATENYRRYPFW